VSGESGESGVSGARSAGGSGDSSASDRGLDASIVASRGGFDLAIDLAVEPGRTLALLGPNGAGKSMTIQCLAGLVAIEAGHIRVDGRVLDDPNLDEWMPTESRRVGVVFQDYLLFPHLTVRDNVAFGPRSTGLPRPQARERASAWLDRLGIASLADRQPGQLSGGQAQRVALARALAAEPAMLLLDEPLAALDAEVRDDVRVELGEHLAEFEGVTIVVTHSLADVEALAVDVVVLERGTVTQRATATELVASPGTAWVERLVRGR
jgi:molybdate transport system ATP-binding protein